MTDAQTRSDEGTTKADVVEMCIAASHDERLSDGMLYRKAADEIVRLREEKKVREYNDGEKYKANNRLCKEIERLNATVKAGDAMEHALQGADTDEGWRVRIAEALEAYRAAKGRTHE